MTIKLKLTKPGNLPYVEFYHGTGKYRFLIDTGSTANWLLTKHILEITDENESRMFTRTLDGRSRTMLSATLRAKPVLGTPDDDLATKFQAEFICSNPESIVKMNENLDIKIHGVLGMDFLQRNSMTLDLHELRLIA